MEAKPWCCHPDCSKDAELRLRDTAEGLPYDTRETDACVEHAGYLGKGSEGVIVVGVRVHADTTIDPVRFDDLVCRCGAGVHPDEAADAGLYIGEDGCTERICGKCWQLAALATPTSGARETAKRFGLHLGLDHNRTRTEAR